MTIALLALVIVPQLPFSPASAQASVAPVQELVSRGDQAFLAREDDLQARNALSAYREAVKLSESKDAETLWRLSMSCYFVGLRLTQDSSQRELIFLEGRDAGLASIALNPHCAACEFWTAINMALYGDTVGVMKMLFSVQDIEAHLKKTIELDPTYAHAGAYRLLGLIQQKLPGILGGSNDRALEYFQKAVETAPDEPLNFQFLAVLLHDDLGRSSQAVEIAKKGLQLPEPEANRLESKEARADLQKLLEKWSR